MNSAWLGLLTECLPVLEPKEEPHPKAPARRVVRFHILDRPEQRFERVKVDGRFTLSHYFDREFLLGVVDR